MTLQEYYNFPEGTNVTLLFIPSFFDTVNTPYPCPSSMERAFAYYNGNSIPELDVSKVTNMTYMFQQCTKLTSLDVSNWDTSNVTNMYYMFSYCSQLTSLDVSNWDTSNVTNMNNMFQQCSKLTSIDLSFLDTSKVTTMGSMFDGCAKLETLSSINCSGITGADSSGAGMFGYSGLSSLKNFGGWINLKKSVTNYGINKCPNLTYESCINVLNGLYDFTGNGTTPASNEGKLKVHQNFLNLVGDEISIGTNKGWTITV